MAGPLYKTMLIMNSVLYIDFKMTGESIVANFAPLHIGGQGEWVNARILWKILADKDMKREEGVGWVAHKL